MRSDDFSYLLSSNGRSFQDLAEFEGGSLLHGHPSGRTERMGLCLAAVSRDQRRIGEGSSAAGIGLHEGDVAAESILGLDHHRQFGDQEAGCRPCFRLGRQQRRRSAARVQLLQEQMDAPQGIVSQNSACKIYS